jgi:predicted SAM-dependent methyltransferase
MTAASGLHEPTLHESTTNQPATNEPAMNEPATKREMAWNWPNSAAMQRKHPFAFSALRSAYRSMVRLRYSRRHRSLIEAAGLDRPAMLQIGCSTNILPRWLNADLKPSPCAVFLDASKKFPFPGCHFDYVFSEHLIEHLDYETGAKMVSEIFRVLRPNGRVRIATPDFDFLVNLYLHPNEPVHQRYIANAAAKFPVPAPTNAVSVVNNFFRDWGHQYIYGREVLENLLISSGFTSVARCDSGESSDANLRGIDSHGRLIGNEFNRLESMIFEGVKPA